MNCVMSKTNSADEQKSRPGRIRREEGSGQHQPDSDRSKASRRPRGSARSEPERTDRTVCEGANQFKSRGQIAGGILRQLIGRADHQLASVDDRLQQLETERQRLEAEREQAQQEREQLQALLENLQQTIQENP